MNIKSYFQASIFTFLLISMSVYADNNQGSNGSQKSGGQQGVVNGGGSIEHTGKSNFKSMHTSSQFDGEHHKHHHGWNHDKGYHGVYGVGYRDSFYEGEYCKVVKGHYNRFGEWVPKHKICYDYED